MTKKTLNDLFLAQLKDIYFAEKQIYKTLPKMAKATRLPELKEAFTAHREQTHGHIERLEEVFEMMGKRSQTKPCEAIKGIISEGEETIEDFGQSPAIDAGLVATGQAVGALRDGALRGSDRLGEAIEYAHSSGSPRRNAAGGSQGGQVADPNRCYRGRQEGRVAVNGAGSRPSFRRDYDERAESPSFEFLPGVPTPLFRGHNA